MPGSHESPAFRDWFSANVSGNIDTYRSYKTYLGRLDRAFENGLDAAYDARGAENLRHWAHTTTQAPFDRDVSSLRSALKRYVEFREAGGGDAANAATRIVQEPPPDPQTIFRLEQQMQTAVRRQLPALEPGLVAIDGGIEQSVATGRIDILARDAVGTLVVIELKAGRCPASALEQALGYAQDLHDVHGVDVRVILIAAEFSDRTRAAAKRVPSLKLFTYQFSMHFEAVS